MTTGNKQRVYSMCMQTGNRTMWELFQRLSPAQPAAWGVQQVMFCSQVLLIWTQTPAAAEIRSTSVFSFFLEAQITNNKTILIRWKQLALDQNSSQLTSAVVCYVLDEGRLLSECEHLQWKISAVSQITVTILSGFPLCHHCSDVWVNTFTASCCEVRRSLDLKNVFVSIEICLFWFKIFSAGFCVWCGWKQLR